MGELKTMASTYLADVTLFDGHRVRRRHGVLVDGDGSHGSVSTHGRRVRRVRPERWTEPAGH